MSQPQQPQAPSRQQAIAQAQVQAITGLLQAPREYGTDKLLVNVNGANSKIKSNKNGIIKYTLEQPVKMEIGDKVTLIESFVEEKGLSIDTIEFENDVVEEVRFLYYVQGNCQNTQSGKGQKPNDNACADVNYTLFPSFYPDYATADTEYKSITQNSFFSFEPGDVIEGSFTNCFPSPNNISQGKGLFTKGVFDAQKGLTCGMNGQYYYLMETWSPYEVAVATVPDNQLNGLPNWASPEDGIEPELIYNGPQKIYLRPMYGACTITIPAGNYSVTALADLINSQLDGARSQTNRFNSNAMIDKLFYETEDMGFVQTSPYFNGTVQPVRENISLDGPDVAKYNPDSLIIGADKFQPFQRRRGFIMDRIIMNAKLTSQVVNMWMMRFIASGNTTPPNYGEYNNGNSMNSRNKSDPPGTDVGPWISASVLATNYQDAMNYWNEQSSDRTLWRKLNSNLYLHLDGVRELMDTDYFFRPDYNYDPKYLPSLADWFLGNIGDQGKFFLNQDLDDRFYAGGGDSVGRWSQISDFKWQLFIPVMTSGNDPTQDINTAQGDDNQGAITDNNFGIPQQFCGTASFELSYDTQKANRFSLKNLHEPYRLPSTTPDNSSDTNLGGQQATVFNTPVQYIFDAPTPVPANPTPTQVNLMRPPRQQCGIYPVDSNGGIAINNWSFSTVKDTGTYKNLVSQITTLNTSNAFHQVEREKLIWELFSKPYDQFFDTEEQAQDAWDTTLWSRLGYSYNQLGDVTNNLETIYSFTSLDVNENQEDTGLEQNPRKVKQLGIITHNDYNYTFIPSSSGLGTGNFYDKSGSGAPPQGYNMRAYNAGVTATTADATNGISQNSIHLLCDSKPIEASDFPSLNGGNNYLLISSDIVKTNAKDAKSNSSTIVGVMSKENASNDTLFSINPITFTITEPKLLATIEVKILNPDGSLVSDDVVGKNNGFIFQIEKAIEPAEIPLQGF